MLFLVILPIQNCHRTGFSELLSNAQKCQLFRETDSCRNLEAVKSGTQFSSERTYGNFKSVTKLIFQMNGQSLQ